MAKSQRNLLLVLVPVALALAWFALGDGVFSRPADNEKPASGDNQATEQLRHAADSIVAAAKERVAAAKSDDEAMQRAQMSFEALQIIGVLGEFDTNPQAGELLDAIRTAGRTNLVDSIVQSRLMIALRQWGQMNDAGRTAAIEGFVANVKKTGLTPGEARLLMRAANMADNEEEGKPIVKALKEIVPLAQNADNAEVKRMAATFDGIVRRLELPGKPLELEGTLLDGKKLDWKSYRGKVVLVDFHASWCGPCRAEVPNILENFRAYHSKGFEVIGINMDTARSGAQQYIEQTGFNFPVIFGDDKTGLGWNHPLAKKYGVVGIPCVILVGQDGKVVSTEARGERLGELLEKLLGPSDQPTTRAAGRNDDSDSVIQTGAAPADPGGVVPASAEEEVKSPQPPPDPPEAPEPPK